MRYTFVKDVRTLRKKEMEQYISKGYLIENKVNYVYSDIINIPNNNEIYSFGIRVNGNEIYFYILHEGCQIFLTIYNIYEMLWQLVVVERKTEIIDWLYFYMKNEENSEFEYKANTYTVHSMPEIITNECVNVLDSDIKISVKELILLIYLIQDKSNYFENLSEEKKYVNGLIRLLCVLLRCNATNAVLETLGWYFNAEIGKYDLREETLISKRNKKRYYLTASEERIIL